MIFGVVLVNAIIGYVQEAKAVSAIEALSQTHDRPRRRCCAAGEKVRLPADRDRARRHRAAGQAGDKVPADLRLLPTRDLQIDESALTGESVPVEKDAHHLAQDDRCSPTAH